MSVFSDMLKNYIHEKDVKVERLANFCKLERSTVYKFINGKREPISAELVEDLAQYIKLTPTETQQFKEALSIFYVIFRINPMYPCAVLPPPQ